MKLHLAHFHGSKKIWALITAMMLVIIGISLFGTFFIRAAMLIVGSSAVLVLPGFFLTLVLFPNSENLRSLYQEDTSPIKTIEMRPDLSPVDAVERMTMAFLFSIVVISGTVFILHKFGIMNPRNLTFAMMLVNGGGVVMVLWRRRCGHGGECNKGY
ncbi:MAG: hypothetical protein Q7S48_03265 [bacterium]|nr:hypothetical protein [bacterium]